MFQAIRVFLVAAFFVLGLAACSPSTATVPYPLTLADTPVATVTPIPSQRPIITIDPHLILTITPRMQTLTPEESRRLATLNAPRPTPNAYCYHPPIFLLSSADARGLSEDQIARKITEISLAYYHSPQAPDLCRIEEYHIDRVYYDEQFATLPLEPKGDFMRAVAFSVRPVQPYFWGALGEFDEQNWLHIGEIIAVFRSDSGYTAKSANP